MFEFLKRKPKYDDHKVIIPSRNVIQKVVHVQFINQGDFGSLLEINYSNFSIDVDTWMDARDDLTFGVLRDRGHDVPWEILVDDQVIATGEWNRG